MSSRLVRFCTQLQIYKIIFLREYLASFTYIAATAPLIWSGALLARDALNCEIMHTEPWGFYQADSDTAPVGIWPEIAAEIAQTSGLRLNIQLAPYARVWRSLEKGETDISFLIRSSDRDDYVAYAGELFTFSSVAISRKGITLRSYDDLKGLRIGHLHDIRLQPRFDNDNSLTKYPHRTYEILMRMLDSGRLDVVAGNSVSLSYLINKMDLHSVIGAQLLLQETPVWVQMSKSPLVATKVPVITTAVDDLRVRGVFNEIINQWVTNVP